MPLKISEEHHCSSRPISSFLSSHWCGFRSGLCYYINARSTSPDVTQEITSSYQGYMTLMTHIHLVHLRAFCLFSHLIHEFQKKNRDLLFFSYSKDFTSYFYSACVSTVAFAIASSIFWLVVWVSCISSAVFSSSLTILLLLLQSHKCNSNNTIKILYETFLWSSFDYFIIL